MNVTMENAIRYLPTTCREFVSHPHTGCYTCREAYASEEQGTTQIAQALINEGIPAFVEQTGGFCMVVYVYSQDRKSAICATAESGAIFYPNIEEREDEYVILQGDDFVPSYEAGCTEQTARMIVEAVKSNMHRLGFEQ